MRLTEAWARTGRKARIYTRAEEKYNGKRLASQIVKEFFTPSKKLFERGLFFSPVGPPKLS